VVAAGGHVARALELAETIAAFPQETMLSDREAAHAAHGLPIEQGLALEAKLGRERIIVALEGARRFRVQP
jgi:enoyl-CoA hydratase